jgi:hypothetical protein
VFSGRGRHQSVQKELRPSVAWLEALPGVERVVLDRTENCRHSFPGGHLKVQAEVLGGLRVVGYGGDGISRYFVKIPDAKANQEVKTKIEERFSN